MRSTPLKRSRRPSSPLAKGWKRRVFHLYGVRCLVCAAPATQAHHVVPRQRIMAARHLDASQKLSLEYDARNGLPVCTRCHERHETATKRIPRAVLTVEHIEWAREFGFWSSIKDRRVYP